MRSICRTPGFPISPPGVVAWTKKYPEFAERYRESCLIGYEMMGDEILAIADTVREGKKIKAKTIGRECSECGKELKWIKSGWVHEINESELCPGAKAKKVKELETVTGDMVERAKLQMQARQWLLSKRHPERYGETVKHTGDGASPLQVVIRSVLDDPK